MTRETKIPPDFVVTDNIREYCARKWSLLYLPDVFLTDFIEVFKENERRHKNWNTTFKTFVRRASPTGPFYGYGQNWERKCEQARRYKGDSKHNKGSGGGEVLDDTRDRGARTTTWKPTPTGEKALKDIRALLEPYADLLK